MVNDSATISIINEDHTDSIPLFLRIFLGIVIIVTMTISICGNMVVCYLVYRKPSMRSAINLLLAHIALSDILLSVLIMPFSLVTLITRRWLLTEIFCGILGFLQTYFISVGVLVLLAISGDRYLIIAKRKEKLNLKRSRKTLLIIWSLCAVVTLPPLFGWTDYAFEDDFIMCALKTSFSFSNVFYVCFFTILTFYVPVLLMLSAFTLIVHIVRKNGMRVQQHPGIGNGNCFPAFKNRVHVDMSFKTRAYKTIFVLSIVLVLCWTPFISLCLFRTFSKDPNSLTLTIFLCLGYLKSATNPIIYAVRIKKFRDACKEIIPKRILTCCEYRVPERRLDHVSTYRVDERSSI
ncbi:hypothetical protein LOTGIDRAFT_105958 [Lottia gigantea]|uniref:G-protein coupled receptors family 1 profile domain-containing protein n=1 Tax=Lottia gigantea TaxID=225164 RepID=V4BL33_LOTGI|nr:hypothetical protein LOTGIDRAFT_105958 [Lottia gigantea]ESO89304.1 hypothetical protein LOTGIDRAFT_105958 [Lottia gigantea]